MSLINFPNVSQAEEDGLVYIGGELTVENLILAYSQGIFPWPVSDRMPLLWFSPPKRALLFLEKFRMPKSLKKFLANSQYKFSIDQNFAEVIQNCAYAKRPKQDGTWIIDDMIFAYIDLHHAGYAHSIECYLDDKLVGGLYGVSLGKMFAGESMFHKEDNASKLCLCYLISYLAELKVEWIDCQQLTPLLESFGAEEVEREDFIKLLAPVVNDKTDLFANLNRG
ncbi:MAG: leucyl/phenylalanyl-tRNA--protein transferase [Proteobacteria bacterium]|nr:leucyl/phenylalanyl-tRNA--protein transferase [Pseudomonadota bacterium]